MMKWIRSWLRLLFIWLSLRLQRIGLSLKSSFSLYWIFAKITRRLRLSLLNRIILFSLCCINFVGKKKERILEISIRYLNILLWLILFHIYADFILILVFPSPMCNNCLKKAKPLHFWKLNQFLICCQA